MSYELFDTVDEPPPSRHERMKRAISLHQQAKWQSLSIEKIRWYQEVALAFMAASVGKSHEADDESIALIGGGTNATIYLRLGNETRALTDWIDDETIAIDLEYSTREHRRALLGGIAVIIAMLDVPQN